MEYARQFKYSSNAERLSGREWLVVGGALLVLAFGLPAAWVWLEPFNPGADYRVPYEFSQDYWHCARWFRRASQADDVLILGDSVVWGEYVAAGDTLTGQLNRLMGRERFANLGMNGLHPAAMLGLIRHHGRTLQGRRVMVVLNTLWMSSARHDLRQATDNAGARVTLNHPALVPQFWPKLAAHSASFEERAGVIVDRAIPFFVWLEHLKLKGARMEMESAVRGDPSADDGTADRDARREPRIDDPLPRPFVAAMAPVPLPDPGPHGQPITWEERGIPETNVPWPSVRESLQWRFFGEVVDLLRSRGNDVCIWVSPFNAHLLTPQSRALHGAMVGNMIEELRRKGMTVFNSEALPSDEYADASHPLASGYERLARALVSDKIFQGWLNP